MSIEQEASALVNPLTYTDPKRVYELMARMRREKPVCKVEIDGVNPVWLVSKNEDIVFIEGNSEIFHAGPRAAVRPIADELAEQEMEQGKTLVQMDGVEHRKYRQIAQAWFMPRNLQTLSSTVKDAAKRYVDLMESKGPACDFASDVAFWYPLRVVLGLADMPEEADEIIVKLTQNLFGAADDELLSGEQLTQPQAAQRLFEFLLPLAEKKKINPGDDLMSVIVHAEVDGKPIDPAEMLAYLLIIVTAGHDTTSASLAGGMLALLEYPEQLQKLKDNPDLIPSAVDEIIRWVAPVKHFARTAMEDVELGGVTIPKGDSLMLMFSSATRDEAMFPDGDQFNIERKPNRHMAFGFGPHMCMGKYLAKMELEAFLTELLPRLDTIELNGEPKYLASNLVSGLKSLPVKFQFK